MKGHTDSSGKFHPHGKSSGLNSKQILGDSKEASIARKKRLIKSRTEMVEDIQDKLKSTKDPIEQNTLMNRLKNKKEEVDNLKHRLRVTENG